MGQTENQVVRGQSETKLKLQEPRSKINKTENPKKENENK